MKLVMRKANYSEKLHALMKRRGDDPESQLERFRALILDHLAKQEDEEEGGGLSKTMQKTLNFAERLAKGGKGLPVGTVREWKGKKYVKVSPGKWRPKYDGETRGAKMAVAAIRRKIAAAPDAQTMLQIVLENRDRFSDQNGQPLPFVQELSAYVRDKSDAVEKRTKEKSNLERAKELSNEIIEKKKQAIKDGSNKVTYEVFGKQRTEYYHSGRWNDRPSTMAGAYHQDKLKHPGIVVGGTGKKQPPKLEKIPIGKVEKWLVDEAKKVGLDIEGFEHEITNEFVNHVINRHGNEKVEAKQGQIAIKESDFGEIPKILKRPDYTIIGAKRGERDIIIYAKKMKDETTLYFEEVLSGEKNRTLRGKTMYKRGNTNIDEDKLKSIVTQNEKTDLSKAKIVVGRGSQSPIGTDTNIDPTVATSAQSADTSNIAQSGGKSSDFSKIQDKYQNAKAVDGDEDEIQVGKEVIPGKWKLVEADTPTASHDEATFHKTPGFPVDESGSTINDRDYGHDKDAQNIVVEIAGDYDGRAVSVDNPVIVTKDGIVISGNNRTMSSKIAAKNGTDTGYIETLKRKAKKFGFTAEQIGEFQHPRVVFETVEYDGYSTEQFAKFNRSSKKAMSPIEAAVKVSKTIKGETVAHIAEKISDFDTLGELYGDSGAINEIFNTLQQDGIIASVDRPQYIVDGGGITGAGKEFLETVLIGSVVDEKNIRGLNRDGCKNIRQKLVRAITPLIENKSMNGYSITKELNEAIDLSMQVAIHKNFNNVDELVSQGKLFGKDEDPVSVEIARRLEGTQKSFAEFMQTMNGGLKYAAQGEADIFLGGVETREDILSRMLNLKKAIQNVIGFFKGLSFFKGDFVKKAVPVFKDGGAVEYADRWMPESEELSKSLTWSGHKLQGRTKFQGMDISIENKKGSTRSGTDKDGHEWHTLMHFNYGYIRGTVGKDKDHLDCYLGPNSAADTVFVVHQNDPVTGKYDEDKIMLGFDGEEEVKEAYLKQYDRPGFLGSIDKMDIETFRQKAFDPANKGKMIKE